jgi:uncharacterized protein YabE (DUF348 family)
VREVRVPIPFTTVSRYTGRLRPGQIQILREGVDGVMLERYRMRVVNGKVVSRDLLQRHVLQPATTARRLVGRSDTGSHGTQVGEASWW